MDMAEALRAVDTWPLEEQILFVQSVWDRIAASGTAGSPQEALMTSAPLSSAYSIASTIASVVAVALSESLKDLRIMSETSQLTPAMPRALSPTAPMMPATCVP